MPSRVIATIMVTQNLEIGQGTEAKPDPEENVAKLGERKELRLIFQGWE